MKFKWAILGCGIIANEMANNLMEHDCYFYAVGNRTYQKALDFANKYHINKVYKNIDDMFIDQEIDVIYISTPHNTHYQYAKKALENNKHVLIEKSITLNDQELEELMKIAKNKNLIIGEAMTIFHMPLYKELKNIIEIEKLGKINLISTNFGSFKEYDMTNRFFSMDLAGGALLDIGIYSLSFIRYFFSSNFKEYSSLMKKAITGVDEIDAIIMKNDDEQFANAILSLHSKQPKRGMISCENAYIEIMEYPRSNKAKITYLNNRNSKEIIVGEIKDALYYEINDMERSIVENHNYMNIDLTLDVIKLMTKIRKDWSLKYKEEE